MENWQVIFTEDNAIEKTEAASTYIYKNESAGLYGYKLLPDSSFFEASDPWLFGGAVSVINKWRTR